MSFFPLIALCSIIQGADWHCMTVPTCNNISVTAVDGVLPEQPSYVRYSALVTLIFCGIMLIAYMGFQVCVAQHSAALCDIVLSSMCT